MNTWIQGDGNRAVGNSNGGGVQINGDVAVTFGEPERHILHVEGRRATTITDRATLVMNLVMTVCAVCSLAVLVAPLRDTSQWESTFPPPPTTTAMLAFVGFTVLALAGWVFWSWLRRGVYGRFALFGRVPEGRHDTGRRNRLHVTKLSGTCAVDGSPMRVRRVRATVPMLYTDGSVRPHIRRELTLICTKDGRAESHRARVDVAATEA